MCMGHHHAPPEKDDNNLGICRKLRTPRARRMYVCTLQYNRNSHPPHNPWWPPHDPVRHSMPPIRPAFWRLGFWLTNQIRPIKFDRPNSTDQSQARTSFEPALDALRVRTVHVMKRLFGVVEHMLKSDGMQMSETHQKPFSECAAAALW